MAFDDGAVGARLVNARLAIRHDDDAPVSEVALERLLQALCSPRRSPGFRNH